MNLVREFAKGLWRENPTFKLVLGMCPTLAVTTSAINGLGMGLATTFVLVCSNVAVSAMRKVIPDKVRIPAYIVLIASFVTVVQLCMEAYVYDLFKALGIFIPLIVVNCIILGRAEAFAGKNAILPSLVDGAGNGSWLHPVPVHARVCAGGARLGKLPGAASSGRPVSPLPALHPPSGGLHRPGTSPCGDEPHRKVPQLTPPGLRSDPSPPTGNSPRPGDGGGGGKRPWPENQSLPPSRTAFSLPTAPVPT